LHNSQEPSSDIPNQPTDSQGQPWESAGRLIVLRGPQAGIEFKLQPGINVFGRREGNVIRDVRVSRRHADIQTVNGEYILFDRQSANGTYVNGQRIHQPVLLQHGDIIRLGDTILVLKIVGQGAQDPFIIGARTPDLTGQNPGGTTVLASRNDLAAPTRTDLPRYEAQKNSELTDPPNSVENSPSG
jgi:pSer/pThr/pTyr-binding forkhead associated (FHA) protein